MEMERWASLGMMVEEIAHQVRNPIVAIGGYSRRLLDRLRPSPKGKSYLNQILRESMRLENLIRRLEEYVLFPKPVYRRERIEKVVEAILKTSSREAAEQGVFFNLETSALEGTGDFYIDKDLITKALSHILENSIEAVGQIPKRKKGKVVKVSLFGNGEDIGVSISDRGEGIPQRKLDRIFEPFFSTRPGRVGLGLTFAKRVVEEQGGSIRVESRSRKGTTVTLTFAKDRRRILRREQLSSENGNRS